MCGKKENTCLVLPWIYSTLFASLLLFMVLLIFFIFPENWEKMFHGSSGHRVVGVPFPFGSLRPLSPLTVRVLVLSSAAYWGTGLAMCLSRFQTCSSLRSICSRICLHAAIAVLFFIIPMLGIIWMLALESGFVPALPWGTYGGNHGPWRQIFDLRKLLILTISMPFFPLPQGLDLFYYSLQGGLWLCP